MANSAIFGLLLLVSSAVAYEERWAVVGQPFSTLITGGDVAIFNVATAPVIPPTGLPGTPAPSDATLPAGLEMERVSVGNPPFNSFASRIFGTPTIPGMYQYVLQKWAYSHLFHIYVGASEEILTLFVLRDKYFGDLVHCYESLAFANNGSTHDYYYWLALRGYYLGAGIEDYALAYYWYYSNLANYYYSYWIYRDENLASAHYFRSIGYAYFYYYFFCGEPELAAMTLASYLSVAMGYLS